jgi:hypothetical protein
VRVMDEDTKDTVCSILTDYSTYNIPCEFWGSVYKNTVEVKTGFLTLIPSAQQIISCVDGHILRFYTRNRMQSVKFNTKTYRTRTSSCV